MVLAVMVCILIFRVYQVLNPPPDPEGPKIFGPANPTPPEESPVPLPPAAPQNPVSEDWTRIWRLTPFRFPPPRTAGSGADPNDTNPGTLVTLEQIRDIGGGSYRAKIRTASRSAWHAAGDQFEQFTLMSIDPEQNCVTIFSEQEAKNLERCIQ